MKENKVIGQNIINNNIKHFCTSSNSDICVNDIVKKDRITIPI